MTAQVTNGVLQGLWVLLVLLSIAQPYKGWEYELRKLTRREINRLAVQEDERGDGEQ